MNRTSAQRAFVGSAAGFLAVALGAVQPGGAAGAASAPVPMPSDAKTDVSAPALSYTGRYVAHIAIPRNQVPARQQVRRTDMRTGASVLLNPAIGGGVAAGNYSMPPVISSDANRVSYSSTAATLVPNDTNNVSDAFVRDVSAGATLLASAAYDGGVANGATGQSSMSKNGRYVAFTSSATDVVPGSTTPNSDVYRRDLQTGTTVQVTLRPGGGLSRGPGATSTDVSGNGNKVAFSSYDSDLVAGDDDAELDLFVRNMTTGRTRWISNGFAAGVNPAGVTISPNGRWVSSRGNGDGSLYLTNVSTGATTVVAANGYALRGSFSSEKGRFVFMSQGAPYVRDLSNGVDTPIPVPAGGTVTNVTISGNGEFAAYDWAPVAGGPSQIFRVAL